MRPFPTSPLPALQPYLVPSVLLQLPASVRWLQVAVPCAGAVLAAAHHLRHLRRLELTGSAMHVDWEDRHGTHAVHALRTLHLTCQITLQLPGGFPSLGKRPCHVPAGVERLGAATQLSSLHLSCLWSDRCADMLARLTALRDLRCAWCCFVSCNPL